MQEVILICDGCGQETVSGRDSATVASNAQAAGWIEFLINSKAGVPATIWLGPNCVGTILVNNIPFSILRTNLGI